MIKKLWHKINCLSGQHTWYDISEPLLYNYRYRECVHCGKQQCKELSERESIEWVDLTTYFKTGTRQTCEKAKKLLEATKTLVDELEKFDSGVKEKTKTFMHLVNTTKGLSVGFIKLKEDIRNLHIRRQKEDLRKETAAPKPIGSENIIFKGYRLYFVKGLTRICVGACKLYGFFKRGGKMKNWRWIHYIEDQKAKYNTKGEYRTLCGKDDFHVSYTEDKNKVTCTRCREILKTKFWYCKNCGFLTDNDVTLEEECSYCGKSVKGE